MNLKNFPRRNLFAMALGLFLPKPNPTLPPLPSRLSELFPGYPARPITPKLFRMPFQLTPGGKFTEYFKDKDKENS